MGKAICDAAHRLPWRAARSLIARVKRLLLVLLGVLVLGPAGRAAAAPPTCRSGQGLAIDGPLRIFGVPVRRDPFGNGGWQDYACLGRSGRALHVGDDIDGGDGYVDVEGWAFAGGRYLAVDTVDAGEEGGDLSYYVYDLRRRRLIAARHPVYDDIDPHAFRVTARGELVTLNAGVVRVGGRRVSARGELATDIGLGDGTLYWTAGGAARSLPLPGAAPDDRLDQPPFLDDRNACMRRAGATVARSASVRVARRAGQLFACGLERPGRLALAPDAQVTIAGDRWLLAADAAATQVLDLDGHAGPRTVPGATAPLLGRDGTLLFTDAAGGLAVQHPGMAAPAALSPPGFGAPALGDGVAYWTAGGAPHRWSLSPPVPPSRSPVGS